MDLLACGECEHRFYVPGVAAADGRQCPECGGHLDLAEHGMQSIPLDAHWLDPRAVPEFEVTVIELRRKRKHHAKGGKKIVRDLADYFPVKGKGRSVQVSVNRGVAAEAALRVAAVLDGVDSGWEDHFYLPTSESQVPSADPRPPPSPARRHLHLVRGESEGAAPEQWA
jgi:hypothetical protein